MARALQLALLAGALVALAGSADAASDMGGAPRWGTELTFYGWSPDARFVAYRRVRRMPPERAGRKPSVDRRSMHRAVKDGRLDGFGPGFTGTLADYARDRGYRAEALAAQRLGERSWRFSGPEGDYRLDVTLGDRLGWRLTLDDVVLVEQPFDTLYVQVQPALYPAPDRSAVALVMLLDTGWVVDGALYTAPLPEAARVRWRAAAAADPPAAHPESAPQK